MIVDEADMEIEMATDPFIEAGIEVPANLPYQDSYQKEESIKKVIGEENVSSSLADKLRKMGGRSRKNSKTSMTSTYTMTMKSRYNSECENSTASFQETKTTIRKDISFIL